MKRRSSSLVLCGLFVAVTPFTAIAASITGTVTNKTVNKPAVGDKVVLIQLQGGMRESNTTTTDAHGKFTLELPDAGPHLIRVDHEKAGYFHIAPPGTQSVDIDVYDVAESVQGVSTEANVMRLETDQQGLHVIQSYFVKNDSTPPRTQLSTHSYEIYLPEGAQIEASAAMAPGGMPVSSSPVPLGDKGHYAFVFPIRPGETSFQISYRLPYSGSFKFSEKLALPADNVAIIMPKAMKFTPSASMPFQPINDDPNAQTFLAKNVPAAQPVEFTVSGTGAMPREAQAGETGPAQGGATGSCRPAGVSGGGQRRCGERYTAWRRVRQSNRYARSTDKIPVVDSGQPIAGAGSRRCVFPSQPDASRGRRDGRGIVAGGRFRSLGTLPRRVA